MDLANWRNFLGQLVNTIDKVYWSNQPVGKKKKINFFHLLAITHDGHYPIPLNKMEWSTVMSIVSSNGTTLVCFFFICSNIFLMGFVPYELFKKSILISPKWPSSSSFKMSLVGWERLIINTPHWCYILFVIIYFYVHQHHTWDIINMYKI